MIKKSEEHPILYTKSPWTNNKNKIHLASTLTLTRNVEKFAFPNKLEKERMMQILSLAGQQLLKVGGLKNPTLVKAEESTPVEKEYISEHFLIPYEFQDARQGQGFVYDETGTFLALLNVGDHIQLQVTDVSDSLDKVSKNLFSLEEELEKAISFSFSPKFGFLTTDPKISGTGFKVHLFLQLPALIHTETLPEALEKFAEEMVEVSGLLGGREEWIGDLVVLSNRYSLGVTEDNIQSSLKHIAGKLVEEEKAIREKIRLEKNPIILDKVSRSVAILSHSYQVGAKEAMDALSMLKLGVDLGWVTGISQEKINELFFMTRRAHLLTHYNEEFSAEELLHKRAEFMHEALKEIKFTEN